MDEGVVRMDAQKWALVAEMFAVNARIEAMKVDNQACRNVGQYSDAYGGESFFVAEEDLNALAQKLRNTI